MKTLHIQNNLIIDISLGVPELEAPSGIVYESVAEDLYVGVGWIRDGVEWLDLTPKPDIIPFPNWVGFNIELLQNTGYKIWARTIRKSNTDDELYYQNLAISVGIQNEQAAQYYYDLIVSKPTQSVRDAVNALALKHNINLVF